MNENKSKFEGDTLNSQPTSPSSLETIENIKFFVLSGGIFCIFAIVLAGHQIILHLRNFNRPNLQLYIVRILLMVPVSNNK
jgi:hypothetical protein